MCSKLKTVKEIVHEIECYLMVGFLMKWFYLKYEQGLELKRLPVLKLLLVEASIGEDILKDKDEYSL